MNNEYVMARVNPVIMNDTSLGVQQPLPHYLAVAEHYLANLKIEKPATGIGKNGVLKQCPILGSDKQLGNQASR